MVNSVRDLSLTETVHVAIRVNHPVGATNIKNPFVRFSPNVLSAIRTEFAWIPAKGMRE